MQELINIDLGEAITDTPIRSDAFELSDSEKMNKIEHHFAQIMNTLGLDLYDDSLRGTPKRVAKMFVKEIFSGLNPDNKPDISLFKNKCGYKKMLIEKDITLYSNCEHHFVPVIGKVHVAYIPDKQVIGFTPVQNKI